MHQIGLMSPAPTTIEDLRAMIKETNLLEELTSES
jgi:hypothetical protein